MLGRQARKLKPGRAVLRGKAGTEDKDKIELKSGDGISFTLLMKDKDHLALHSPSGRCRYEQNGSNQPSPQVTEKK
jgi:hypothetical protein